MHPGYGTRHDLWDAHAFPTAAPTPAPVAPSPLLPPPVHQSPAGDSKGCDSYCQSNFSLPHRSIRRRKTTFDFCKEMYGAPAKNCSGPENRDASILVGKHIANAIIFSTVFDRFRAPRSIEASASIDSASKKRRSISVQKCTARQQKIVRAPKTAMRRFY